MNEAARGLEKAKAFIRKRIASYGAPDEVDLTKYGNAVEYNRHHPGEDFVEHSRQREQLVAWMTARGIKVIDRPIEEISPTPFPMRTDLLAQKAVRPPWRLGISISGRPTNNTSSTAVIGWAAVDLATKKTRGIE